jgi:hypothetical protein
VFVQLLGKKRGHGNLALCAVSYGIGSLVLSCCVFCAVLCPQMRVVPRLTYAAALEKRQHSLLPCWQWPTWLMLFTWLVVHIYSFIRYNLYGNSPWQHVTMWVSTDILSCCQFAALTGCRASSSAVCL